MAVTLREDTKNKFKDIFSRQLKYFRTEILKCSQEELASKLNVSLQHYKNMEHGLVIPSSKMLILLAEEFNLGIDYLFLYLRNGATGDKKSQEQIMLEQINNTCSDSVRRALIYHWNMYLNPKNKSGFNIVEDPSFSSEDDTSAKQGNSKSQAD